MRIIGGEKKSTDEEIMGRVLRTTQAILSVCGCGTTNFQEGFDSCASATGNLLAAVFPDDPEKAKAHLEEKTLPGIMQAYEATRAANASQTQKNKVQ